ncbi:MAG: DUF433 domain-containing protein [Burkholderiales bacterium]|nr:DUF433 domain-containing protein [Burkholderiales bacterium]
MHLAEGMDGECGKPAFDNQRCRTQVAPPPACDVQDVSVSTTEFKGSVDSSPQWYDAFMIDWSTCPAVERDLERVSGAWVFAGTRVPVAALFENLEGGAQISQFVEWFPGVTLEQVRAVLEHAARSALAPA